MKIVDEYLSEERRKEIEALKIFNKLKGKVYDNIDWPVVRSEDEKYVFIPLIGGGHYFNEVGMYEIIFSASNGNESLRATFYLEIIDSEIEFTYDEKLLVAKKDVLYTYEDINSIIKLYASRNDYTYDVIEDEYSENYDKVGDYPYVVHIKYEDGIEEDLKITFRVLDENNIEEKEEREIKKPNFFEKVWAFMKKMAIILYKILKWPFTLIKF